MLIEKIPILVFGIRKYKGLITKVEVYPSEYWPIYGKESMYRIRIDRRWYPFDMKFKAFTKEEIGNMLAENIEKSKIESIK